MKIPRYWTEHECRLLKKYREEGFSNREIGEKLDRSICSIAGKIFRLDFALIHEEKSCNTSRGRKRHEKIS